MSEVIKEIYVPLITSHNFQQGIGTVLFERLKLHGDKIAQIDANTGQKETFKELLRRSIQVALKLKEKGLKPGDIVLSCTFNDMDYSVIFLASLFTGLLIAPFEPVTYLDHVTHYLNLIKPKIAFCILEVADTIDKVVQHLGIKCEIVVFGEHKKYAMFSQYVMQHVNIDGFQVESIENPTDTACILQSSGTTGLPKAVATTHYGFLHAIFLKEDTFQDVTVQLTVTKPFWISNVWFLITSCYSGTTRIICNNFDDVSIMKLLEKYEANFLMLPPAQVKTLVQNPEVPHYNTSKVKYIAFGGGPVNAKYVLKLMDMFPNSEIYNGYGMTEIGSFGLFPLKLTKNNLRESNKIPLGVPVAGCKYRVVDTETEEILGPNKPGELRLKFDGVMNNYHNQPELYEKAFDKNHYLKTGDLVYYDEEFRFYYVERLKEIFKYKGTHISPTLIEKELLKHPEVMDAVAIGVPSEIDGELPTGVVVLKEGSSIKPDDIAQYIKDRLSDWYHLRGGVYIVNNLPQTANGKLNRKYVQNMVTALRQ